MAQEGTGNIAQRGVEFVREVWDEMRKVNWTSRDQLWQATKVVIFGTLVMGGVLFAIDRVFVYLLKWLLG